MGNDVNNEIVKNTILELNSATTYSILKEVFKELAMAEEKHPGWPKDKIHATAVIVEEAGEAMKAAIDFEWNNGNIEDLKKEILQTAAMCIRALIGLRRAE